MKGRRCAGKKKRGGGAVTTPVASKKRKGMPTKKLKLAKQAPQPKGGRPEGQEDGLDMIDVLLDISSRLEATEAYIAAHQETERINHMSGTK